MNYKIVALGAVAAALTASAFATTLKAPVLLTAQQQEVDALALSLRDEPAVKAAREAALKRWQQLRAAGLADGKAQLPSAIDEAVYIALRATAGNDPSRPRVLWTLTPPYEAGKQSVPGSRFGGDNPDRIYRSVALDPKYRYEIRGRRNAQPSLDAFSFEAVPLPSVVGTPLISLSSKDIDIAKDGSFALTADATPANGRRNHLQLPPTTSTVLLRDTLVDWSSQLPNELTVKRLDGGEAPLRSRAQLAKEAAAQITGTVEGTVRFIDSAWKAPANQITPFVRPLDWGVPGDAVAVNRFSLKDDEALVVTLDRIGAKYLGFQLTDPWLRSVNYWDRSSSLSDRQAKANADGSFTYVLSAKDPGVHNWLDTGGLRDGDVVIRWEGSVRAADIGKAVRESRVVKLAELAAALPANTPRVSASERKTLLAARRADYGKRVALQ